jgi:phosphoribosylcarboxyaminoimidazole (NCAIR) mutase
MFISVSIISNFRKRGIKKAEESFSKLTVRHLLSIDRARGVEHVHAVLELLEDFKMNKYIVGAWTPSFYICGLVTPIKLIPIIGIDVSGNPAKGADAQDAIVKCLEKVKAGGRFKGVLKWLFWFPL